MTWEVYENATPSRSVMPYLLNVQNDLCRSFATRIIIPITKLAPAAAPFDLCISAVIEGQTVFCLVPQLTAVTVEDLGRCIGSLASMEYEFKRAIDRQFSGW